MSYIYDESTIEAHGLKFNVSIDPDTDSGRPWDECDGFGPVREATKGYYERHVTKAAGERILFDGDRNEYTLVYDWAAAMKEARKDGWGVCIEEQPANWGTLTRGQKAAIAVTRSFEFLKAWCDEEWVWCGVTVALADYEGPLDLERSLWAVEYWQYEGLASKKNAYLQETIDGMMQDIADTYKKEEAEKQACAERDIVTV